MNTTIREAHAADIPAMMDIFWEHITQSPEYISHGEMQMGVADFSGKPTVQGKEKWLAYIRQCLSSKKTQVMVAEIDGTIGGFSIISINNDGGANYGMLNDILISSKMRGKGIGSKLLEEDLAWFAKQGLKTLYLESGKNNHAAHDFFERHGFLLTSYIFRTEIAS
ncbi:MAG: GNAT family N-acetyltransferase [Spirochaetaceae bacterium]|jgi:L-amino acid N-acyltransferase YncA|nr:GNAT family N-acetyltransferase [Spirochaetaceae bacterium]